MADDVNMEFDCDETENVEDDNGDDGEIYLPGQQDDYNGKLECDESAYLMYHQAQTGAPCLSFDVIRDTLGDDRAEQFPLTAFVAAGTQGQRSHVNNVIVMKMSNMNKIKHKKETQTEEEEDEDSGSEEEEDEDDKPILDSALIPHQGCVNRLRVTSVNGITLACTWSETGKVFLWNLSHPLKAVNNHIVMTNYVRNNEAPKPIFSFAGHQTEGYAIDWSPTVPGVLATGDCNKNIHVWKPMEGNQWHVDQRAYTAHSQSVEDIQWSPNEPNVLASCSVDRTIRIWDTRANPNKACMLTTENAHESDVNVISWNRTDPFLVSGGDDGVLKIWDLRNFKSGQSVAVFKHHTAPITSVHWHPTDSTVFAAAGSDDQLTIWDLALERDVEASDEKEANLQLPPQLLFIHQGQNDIKELQWHPQMPGVVISTAQNGFNIFRTISV